MASASALNRLTALSEESRASVCTCEELQKTGLIPVQPVETLLPTAPSSSRPIFVKDSQIQTDSTCAVSVDDSAFIDGSSAAPDISMGA